MIQQSLTPQKTLSYYQDLLHKAKTGQTITVPQEHVTLVTRMAHRLYIEKNIKVKAEVAAAPVRVQPVACDRCAQGVMDATNPHFLGICECECHRGKVS